MHSNNINPQDCDIALIYVIDGAITIPIKYDIVLIVLINETKK